MSRSDGLRFLEGWQQDRTCWERPSQKFGGFENYVGDLIDRGDGIFVPRGEALQWQINFADGKRG